MSNEIKLSLFLCYFVQKWDKNVKKLVLLFLAITKKNIGHFANCPI